MHDTTIENIGHLNDSELRAWLDNGCDGPSAFVAHLMGCDECADRAVHLDGVSWLPLAAELAALLAPPPGLADRLDRRIRGGATPLASVNPTQARREQQPTRQRRVRPWPNR